MANIYIFERIFSFTMANNTEAVVAEEKQEEELADFAPMMLPLCEANRSIVVDPTFYAANVVFQLGTLTLIDKAP